MKKNAFTLTELIAVIAIIGIVILISIPVIKNMTTKNTEEKYMAYVTLVENALKTYADTEMPYGSEEGLSIPDLISKGLITEFKDASVDDNKKFTVRKETNGKVNITTEVKIEFTKGSNKITCTKNSCSQFTN